MSALKNMSEKYRIYGSEKASTENEIKQLIRVSSVEVPKDFLEIIREQTEIEMNVAEEKYIRIWGAKGCIEMNEAYKIQQYIPSSLAIGDDGDGNALIYANGKSGFGLYIIAFNDLDFNELQYVASSLSELLMDNNIRI